jgi:hypothetical protein
MQPMYDLSLSDQKTPKSAIGRVLPRIAAGGILALIAGCAAPSLPPVNDDLPEALRAPAGVVLEDILTAQGEVLYECARNSNQLAWVEHGVEATLANAGGENVGTVIPGGYFTAYDGSYVITQIAAEAVVTPENLSWARATTRFTAARRPGEGRFSRTALIQRVDTKGGLSPTSDCALEGSANQVPYSATYMVYRSSMHAPETIPTTPDVSTEERQEGTYTAPGTMPSGIIPLPDH